LEGLGFDNKADPIGEELSDIMLSGRSADSVSASRLESYAGCPFRYFVDYGLKPEERRIFETGSREIGDVYHDSLMKVTSELTKNGLWESVTTEQLREMKTPYSGGISLGYIYSVSFSALPEFVNNVYMHQGNEQIAFRFRQGKAGELIEQLLNGSLDFLIAERPDMASIDCIPVYRQELYLIVPATHRLADADSVTLADIEGERFISLNHETLSYHKLEKEFKRFEFEPNTIIEADEYSSIAASVSTGAGVAIMPILPILDSFNVRKIPFADSSMYRDICLLRSSSHEMSAAAKSVWDLAKQISDETIERGK
jgi:DNA-binding transcriptional LysR family regulator